MKFFLMSKSVKSMISMVLLALKEWGAVVEDILTLMPILVTCSRAST